MAFGYNSTIRRKKKSCKRCGAMSYIFSNGRCQQCSKIESVQSAMEEDAEEVIKEEGLSELIAEADRVYSLWLRRSGADKKGIVKCFTCDKDLKYQDSHAGHYVKRGNLFLRWDSRNVKIQCPTCNVYKDGNYPEYTRRLEEERPGITEYLMQEGALVYKPTRDEIRNIINEYSQKLKLLK